MTNDKMNYLESGDDAISEQMSTIQTLNLASTSDFRAQDIFDLCIYLTYEMLNVFKTFGNPLNFRHVIKA